MHLVMIGGSDAGISAALCAGELDPPADVTVAVADAYPNFSICGIPYYVSGEADDHKAYYPGSHRIAMRVTGDRRTGRLLGLQLYGHRHAEIAKRIDIAAAAIYNGMTVEAMSDLDLSYTPPLGSPWEAVQMGAQAWDREVALLRA
jgi:NADPH-dependent 2,4-dienoyl-CoA reductase/sulfur reductase-like enzyme